MVRGRKSQGGWVEGKRKPEILTWWCVMLALIKGRECKIIRGGEGLGLGFGLGLELGLG